MTEKADPLESRALGAASTCPPLVTIVSGSTLHALSLIALPFADEPLKLTVPKLVRGRTRQLRAHSDGASAIHSAELSPGFANVFVVLKLFLPPESVSVKLPLLLFSCEQDSFAARP